MITLRDLVGSDRAIAAITTDECHLIAKVLDAANRNWFTRRKFKDKTLQIHMLAATLARSKAEREPSDVRIQIYREMQKSK